MEEGDGDAHLIADFGEPRLRLEQLPVGRKEAAVLVGVGIADHHFLKIALRLRAAAHDGDLQQIAHDRRRVLKVADRLEQRNHRQGNMIAIGGRCEQPRLSGEEIDAEHVIGR